LATFRALAKGDLDANAALASAVGWPPPPEVADAAPATALRTRGAVLREGAALPRLSETGTVNAGSALQIAAGLRL
jgi:hypothetical protein